MFSSMNAVDAWTPQQHRASLWDELKSSPCRTCKYIHDDKGVCRLLPTCPIHISTLLGPQEQKYRKGRTKPPAGQHECAFPGCTKMCGGTYCNGRHGHAQLIYTRRLRHPNNSERWLVPVGVGGKGSRLAERVND